MAIQLKLGVLGIQLTLDAAQFERGVKGAMGAFGALESGAMQLGKVVGGALAAGVGASVLSFARLEQELMNAAAVTLEGAENFEKFQAAAMAASAGSVFSSKEAASALKYMSMAGLKAGESIEALPAVLKMATAGNVDLAFTADLVTNVMTGMGLAARDLVDVGDLLVKTATTSNTNMQGLGMALSYAASTAADAGQDLKEMTTAIGMMANAGVTAERIGTALRMGLIRLQAPTGKGAKYIKALGLETKNAAGQMRPLSEIMVDLTTKMSQFRPDEATKAWKEIFGVEAMGAFQAIAKQGVSAIKAYRKEMDNAGGTAERVAKLMESTISSQMKVLAGNAENVAATFGQMLAPAVRTLNDYLKNLILGILNTDEGYNTLRTGAANLVQALGDLLLGFGALVRFGYKVAGVFGELANELDGLAAAAEMAYRGFNLVLRASRGQLASQEDIQALLDARQRMIDIGRLSGKIYKDMAERGKKATAGLDELAGGFHSAAVEIRAMERPTFNLTRQLGQMGTAATAAARGVAKIKLPGKQGDPAKATGSATSAVAKAMERAREKAAKEEAKREKAKKKAMLAMERARAKAAEAANKKAKDAAKELKDAQDAIKARALESVWGAGSGTISTLLGSSGLGKIFASIEQTISSNLGDIMKIAQKKGGLTKLSFGDFKEMIIGGLAKLSQTMVAIIMENEQMQKNLSVVKQIAKNAGLKNPLTAIFELYRAPLGAISAVVKSLKPVFDMLGGGVMKNMGKNFFNAAKFFLSTVLGVSEVLINVSQRIMSAMAWLIGKVAGALNKVGIQILDNTAARLASSADQLATMLDTVRKTQDELAGMTYAEAMDEYNRELAKATDNFSELNDELKNVPAGFKRALDLIRYDAQDMRTNARVNGGRTVERPQMRTRVQASSAGTTVNGDIVMALPSRATANEYKRQLAAQEFAYRGRTGGVPSRSQSSKKRAYR